MGLHSNRCPRSRPRRAGTHPQAHIFPLHDTGVCTKLRLCRATKYPTQTHERYDQQLVKKDLSLKNRPFCRTAFTTVRIASGKLFSGARAAPRMVPSLSFTGDFHPAKPGVFYPRAAPEETEFPGESLIPVRRSAVFPAANNAPPSPLSCDSRTCRFAYRRARSGSCRRPIPRPSNRCPRAARRPG